MLAAIRDMAATTPLDTGGEAMSESVMAVMGRVPRHEFVPERMKPLAYLNRPLPIGHGQTISQPYIVALMTDLLDVDAEDVVLEVGTGSGYQAAVLGELVRKVYTVEVIAPLGEQAAGRLARLKYDNIESRVADGYYGWEEHAPFDGIMVTAAAGHVPPPLIRQLKRGGRMLIPVGGRFLTQYLMIVEKDEQGAVTTSQVLPVRFVPLTGEH
ncbi:MAG: protein-L-isoaspartate(D-aspartate) O-methyltransferase [Gammaproteobacteria bacterium]|nr:protein-L-isoaspartate(D-aspartate) O-methyltransferase [Gammaproteobacteria bacterium]MDJ0870302.1 protein-L-isoaspartate(D-aspartate) O-methyltransferase [Gammaproteobacteria bacterium]